jgi:hypothetical protein
MRYPLVAALRVDRIFAMQNHATSPGHRRQFRFKLGSRLVTPPLMNRTDAQVIE